MAMAIRAAERVVKPGIVGVGKLGLYIAEQFISYQKQPLVVGRTPGKLEKLKASGAQIAASHTALVEETNEILICTKPGKDFHQACDTLNTALAMSPHKENKLFLSCAAATTVEDVTRYLPHASQTFSVMPVIGLNTPLFLSAHSAVTSENRERALNVCKLITPHVYELTSSSTIHAATTMACLPGWLAHTIHTLAKQYRHFGRENNRNPE